MKNTINQKKFKTSYEVLSKNSTKGINGFYCFIYVDQSNELKKFPCNNNDYSLVVVSDKKMLIKYIPWIPESKKLDVENRAKNICNDFENLSLIEQIGVLFNLHYIRKLNNQKMIEIV